MQWLWSALKREIERNTQYVPYILQGDQSAGARWILKVFNYIGKHRKAHANHSPNESKTVHQLSHTFHILWTMHTHSNACAPFCMSVFKVIQMLIMGSDSSHPSRARLIRCGVLGVVHQYFITFTLIDSLKLYLFLSSKPNHLQPSVTLSLIYY